MSLKTLKFEIGDRYAINNVRKIDGIPVDVIVGRYFTEDKEIYYVHIISSDIMCCCHCETPIHLGYYTAESIDKILKYFKKLKPNYLHNDPFTIKKNTTYVYLDPADIEPNEPDTESDNKEPDKEINEGSIFEFEEKECAVCKEDTFCRTICGHKLCVKCHHKCKVDDKIKCPVCRTDIRYVKKYCGCCDDE